MTARDTFTITTAIAYPNGKPHMGHAYEAIATDFIARVQRLEGKTVVFVTGTDEHGLKMVQTARREGMETRAFADSIVPHFHAMLAKLDISHTAFVRTSSPEHRPGVTTLWQRMAANGDIYRSRYEGWYSVRDEAYYAEDELVTGEDGQKLSPEGTAVEWTVEDSYFFRLSAYGDKLLKLFEDNPDFIQPESRRNEMIAFIKRGLKELSISRTSFDWGVPVPGDPEHVMYVWVDALTAYMTGVGYDGDMAQWERAWPADVHIIGKDIVRFHTIYWPAFLMSAGLPLPRRVFGHGFVLNKGVKMSKSLGNVVDPMDLADTYGVDQLRYFLLREVPFGQDGSYSHDAIVGRTNADLANGLGNLAQRSLSMIAKNCEGKLPQPGALSEADAGLLAAVRTAAAEARAAMGDLAIHRYLDAVWGAVAAANLYFTEQAPWALRKTDPARADTVLYVTAEALRVIAILAQPAMPASIGKLLDQLAVADAARSFAALDAALTPGTALPAPQGVFPRWVEPAEA
jgi:methionyl-tRNA synthetase